MVEITSAAAGAAEDFCRSLERACRESRMYPPDHPTLATGFQRLVAAATRVVEAVAPARLVIGDTNIRLLDEPVYTGSPGTENLAFILFRDGIRELLLYPGVERDELAQLVDALANVDAVDRWDHDLVTVLWEADLLHIDYVVADPMLGGAEISIDLIDSLRDTVLRKLAEAEESEIPPEFDTTAADTVPVGPNQALGQNEARCLLALMEQPFPALSAVVDEQEDPCPLDELHVFLLPLLAACESPESATLLVRSLTAEIGRRIQLGDLATARHLVEQLHQTVLVNPVAGQAMQAWDPAAAEYRDAVRKLLVDRSTHGGTNHEADLILHDPLLRPILLPALVDLLAQEGDRNVRRSILSLLTSYRDLPAALLVPYLKDGRWYVVRNMIQLLAFSADARPLPDLKDTVHHPDERVRKEVVRTLERMGTANHDASVLLRRFLRDPDPGVRTLAARVIGPQAGEAGLNELLDHLERPDFPTRSPDEVEAMCTALARVADGRPPGDRAVSVLSKLWRSRFWKSNPATVRIAALRALAALEGPEAMASLQAAAGSKDGTIRAIAAGLLANRRSGGDGS